MFASEMLSDAVPYGFCDGRRISSIRFAGTVRRLPNEPLLFVFEQYPGRIQPTRIGNSVSKQVYPTNLVIRVLFFNGAFEVYRYAVFSQHLDEDVAFFYAEDRFVSSDFRKMLNETVDFHRVLFYEIRILRFFNKRIGTISGSPENKIPNSVGNSVRNVFFDIAYVGNSLIAKETTESERCAVTR